MAAESEMGQWRGQNMFTPCNKEFCIFDCMKTCHHSLPCDKKKCATIYCDCGASMCRSSANGCGVCNGHSKVLTPRDTPGTMYNMQMIICHHGDCGQYVLLSNECEKTDDTCKQCEKSHWCRECILKHGSIGG
jgi:hypothetical protein